MSVLASVIICTHNPRDVYLLRVLKALAAQTTPYTNWELLLIDNASTVPVSGRFDITWHPNGRHIHEPELGLTSARLRGISEATTDVLVFVDDDNVLASDYLEVALKLSAEYPFLGAWGGTIHPEFESPPAEWTRDYWPFLAIRHVDRPIWGNDADSWKGQPCGAGLVVRAEVAGRYSAALKSDPVRRSLDRRGESLLSTGDTDLILTCGDSGLGWGNFPQLSLTHLIPQNRLKEKYVSNLLEGMATSEAAMRVRRGTDVVSLQNWKLWARCAKALIRYGPRRARFLHASLRGQQNGVKLGNNKQRLDTDALPDES